mgnify:CR=1 FL=1|tara:strand:+ start:1322 stop:1861 length:540 start_codon:yes stop_codon:yes gene_type:complete
MELLLIYSNKCKNSQLVKKYEIFNKVDKLNIDNKNELKHLPKYVKSVPTLVIKKNEKLTILKNNELLHWLNMNSNSSNTVYNQNNTTTSTTTKNTSEENTNVNESNTLVNNNFSSTFSFIDSSSDNLLETFYSNVNSNPTINTVNTVNGGSTRENKTLDNDYERLMKERSQEFKSPDRF